MRQLLEDGHGYAALLSFSNVAVETFKREFHLLARERTGSPRATMVDIDTVDGFLTTHVIRPHAHRTMAANCVPFLVDGTEAFLKGFSVFAGGRPHLTAGLECNLVDSVFKFEVPDGPYSTLEVSKKAAEEAIEKLGKTGAYTHSMGRYWTIRTLKSQPFVLKALVRRYPSILIDEAQDIGPEHQSILEMMIEAGCQLSLIGDANQAIFDFTGATGEFLRKYTGRPGVKPARLTVNYRSVPSLVAVANALTGQEDKADREDTTGLRGAYFIPFKKKDKEGLRATFQDLLDTAGIAASSAAILCRSNDWVEGLRGSEDAQGQGAVRLLAQAAIARDKARQPAECFRLTCAALTTLLPSLKRDLGTLLIRRLDILPDSRALRRLVWSFASDGETGLPRASLIADSEWHREMLARVKNLLNNIQQRHGLNQAENLGNRLSKRELLNRPLVDLDVLALGSPATFRVATVHQVKGESIEAVMYATNKDHASALVEGPSTEVGRIGYVALTRARTLFVLAVPESCKDELAPTLSAKGFREAGHKSTATAKA